MNKKENRIETCFGVLVIVLALLSVVLCHFGKKTLNVNFVICGLCGFSLLFLVCSAYSFWRKRYFRAILCLVMIVGIIVDIVRYS